MAEPEFQQPNFELDDGKLEIINRGEFGGALNFIPNQKSLDTIQIWNVPINFVFNFKGKIYFMSGIAHMGDHGGAIFELKRRGNKFIYKQILKLDSAPEAIAIYNNKILIAGHQMFTVVEGFEKENLVEDAFWCSLYPNSIAVKSEKEVYIGMRGGYSRLSLNSGKIQCFKYREKI